MGKKKFPPNFFHYQKMRKDEGGWGVAMKMWATIHLEKVALRTVPLLNRGGKNDK